MVTDKKQCLQKTSKKKKKADRNIVFPICSACSSQFLVYFIYFTLLTVMYFVGAALVIFRHSRNQLREGVETAGQPVELRPAGTNSETEALSNSVPRDC